jgi:hypothetical protein
MQTQTSGRASVFPQPGAGRCLLLQAIVVGYGWLGPEPLAAPRALEFMIMIVIFDSPSADAQRREGAEALPGVNQGQTSRGIVMVVPAAGETGAFAEGTHQDGPGSGWSRLPTPAELDTLPSGRVRRRARSWGECVPPALVPPVE